MILVKFDRYLDAKKIKEYTKIRMATVISRNQKLKMDQILKELRLIKDQLQKFLVLIPEESLKEYKNEIQIKKAYPKALKKYPPK